jgi:hypothetical protein
MNEQVFIKDIISWLLQGGGLIAVLTIGIKLTAAFKTRRKEDSERHNKEIEAAENRGKVNQELNETLKRLQATMSEQKDAFKEHSSNEEKLFNKIFDTLSSHTSDIGRLTGHVFNGGYPHSAV